MATVLRVSVISPEAGIQRSKGKPPPFIRESMPSKPTFSERLDTLENKTVYMVDIGFGGGYNFMVQLEKWFNENMPSVTTIVRRKPGQVFMDDRNDLWEEVKEKGDAVVLGVAG
jgi:hypothetical protein